MTPKELLEEAARTLGTRGDAYGDYSKSLSDIAEYWRLYLKNRVGVALTAYDQAMLMLLLKIARAQSSPGREDHYIDMAGYAALAGGLATHDDSKADRGNG